MPSSLRYRFLLHFRHVNASSAPENATRPARLPTWPSVPSQVRSTGPSVLMSGACGLHDPFRTFRRYFTLFPNCTEYEAGSAGRNVIVPHIVGGIATTTSSASNEIVLETETLTRFPWISIDFTFEFKRTFF